MGNDRVAREDVGGIGLCAPSSPSRDREEARRVLLGRLSGKAEAIPTRLLVDHLLEIGRGWSWRVLEAAGEELSRRLRAVSDEELRVAARPSSPLGVYRVRPRGAAPRPYDVVIAGVAPLDGRCGCPDYSRASLGLCKHLLAAFEDLFAQPRRLARARAASTTKALGRSRLEWDPIRPLDGPGDWLARVVLHVGRRPPAIARFFHGSGAERRVDPAHLHGPRRAALVAELRAWLRRRPADAELRPALVALLEEAAESAAPVAGRSARIDRALRGLAMPLHPHQREGVHRFLERGRLLLGDDMGLGKTVQAIAAAHVLHELGEVRRGLLLVPCSLKHQWRDEWKRFTSAPVRLVEGKPAARRRLYASTTEGFLIANPEQLLRDAETIRAWDPELVVLDEAQRIKNAETRTARTVKEILRAPYRLAMTGTPLENRLDELTSLMGWIDDRALEPTWRIAPQHTVPDPEGSRAIGVTGLDTLRLRIEGGFLRRRREEVLDQLPRRTDHRVPVELTDAQRDLHDDLDRPIARLASTARRRPLTRPEFLKLMALITQQRVIANGLAQRDFATVWPSIRGLTPTPRRLASLHSPKIEEFRERIARLVIEEGRKVVVFSQWRRMTTLARWAVTDLLESRGLRSASFTGEQGLAARVRSVVDLHDDDATRVLFCTDAGSVGLNLQRASDCVVHLDLPWNPAVFEQRVARIHRMGQHLPIDVTSLVAESSIETRIEQALRSKKAMFGGLFDGVEDTVLFDPEDTPIVALSRLAPEEPPAPAPVVEEAADDAAPDDEAPPTVASPIAPTDIDALFGQLEVRREAGRLTLSADGPTADALERLLAGLAGLLRSASAAA
ncbi:MAG: DEAD/DEAH box helicase [Myxococcales bacterium]|nr:DEAD/DEAH box helicase [Myxococcales bacterium]